MLNRILTIMENDWTRKIDFISKYLLPSDSTILNIHAEYYSRKNETHVIFLIDEKGENNE